jgi:glycosyltransferase involved in cell wall biosynthesis
MSDKIKIVYLIDQLNIGGTENQLLATVNRLDRAKFEPLLVCLRPSEYFSQCKIQCYKHLFNVGSLASLDGLKKLIEFSMFLRKQKIDIVQTFFFDSTVFGVLSAKLARVGRTISCRRDMGFWYNPTLLKVLRVINLMTDRILVNSRAIKDNVVEKEHVRPSKIDVLYNGIDIEPFSIKYDMVTLRSELGIPPADKIVGIVANLNRQVKRVDLFVSAAAHVLQKRKQVSFVIVGDGHLRIQLERQASELGILNKIHFVGSQDNVIPYLQLMDIGVLTSESEGFSNSILEYMMAGLPVVCFDSGGNCELVTDKLNGLLINEQSELSDKINSALANEPQQLYAVMEQNLTDVQEFEWGSAIKRLEKYYLNLQ